MFNVLHWSLFGYVLFLNAGDELCFLFVVEVGEEQESEESGEEEGEEEGTESDLVRST